VPKINEYINLNKPKPVEIVQELKDEHKVPSFEEFMKDYRVDEKVESGYRGELESYSDIRVEKGYGPGNSMSEEEKKETLKKTIGVVGGVGTAALSIACPPAGAAVMASTAIYAGTAKTVSALAPKDSTTKEIADFAGDICIISGSIGSGPNALKRTRDEINKK